MFTAAEVLQQDGLLARHIKDYSPREPQQIMATAVENAMQNNQTLICEAGTGTGKTFAYLVPALLSGKKTIISTGTRNLQDQLYHRDLPLVRNTLGVPVDIALLKGRANYLCLHRLELYEDRGRFRDRRHVSQLAELNSWKGQTASGDISELSSISEDATIWPHVTSTTDNCLGQECSHYNNCFVLKARRASQEADVVVVNHHLFFADMALREVGFGEVLPGAEAFILDEAHQLPEVAARFFGVNISSRQLAELASDTVTAQIKEAGDMENIRDVCAYLEKATSDLILAMGKNDAQAAFDTISGKKKVRTALKAVIVSCKELSDALEAIAERGKELEACWRRAEDLHNRLIKITESPPDNHVQWVETRPQGFAFHLTPLDIADPFGRFMQLQQGAWVFTSATLAVGDSFQFFAERMGLNDAELLKLESPFDYSKQAILYHPEGLPDPNAREYTDAVIKAALPVIEYSKGRTFFLFTSYRALYRAQELLEDVIEYPLLVQGSVPRDELLTRFRNYGNAVLLGTSSFWEGVDVRGEALSCVIIDRLPFASPDDPVLQARIDTMKKQGSNPFMDYQLPHAVIMLKQGTGRLIRDVNDRGVMMLCDPRLTTKPYGRIFIKSLPAMRYTRDIVDVMAFFE